jgi:addiction module HigA family antidote
MIKDSLDDLGLSITEAAKVLGVSRPVISRVINGHAALSPEMAVRLAKAFGSTPEFWLRLQQNYDVAQMNLKAEQIQVKRYAPLA